MITFLVRLRAGPGHEDRVATELASMARLTHVREPDCHAYVVHRSVTEPDLFVIYEQYENEHALEFHRNSNHFHTHVEAGVLPVVVERSREDLVILSE